MSKWQSKKLTAIKQDTQMRYQIKSSLRRILGWPVSMWLAAE